MKMLLSAPMEYSAEPLHAQLPVAPTSSLRSRTAVTKRVAEPVPLVRVMEPSASTALENRVPST